MMAVSEVASSTAKGESKKSRQSASKRCKLRVLPISGTSTLSSGEFDLSNKPLAESIRAQEATNSIVFDTAVVAANQIKAGIGGNLNIKSLQDKSTHTSSQKSASASVSVGGGLLAANLSAGNANAAKWQADNCSALTAAACETKFQVAALRGELLPNNVLPSNSLGGRLAGMTDFKSPHEYAHSGTVCDGSTPNSTYNALRQYPGPGSSGDALVGNGTVSPIKLGPFLLGYVTHLVDPATRSVVNITVPGSHGLDPGWVVRQVGVQPDGVTSVNSYGAGTGANPFNINVLGVAPVWGYNVQFEIKRAANPVSSQVGLGSSPVNSVLCARFGDCK